MHPTAHHLIRSSALLAAVAVSTTASTVFATDGGVAPAAPAALYGGTWNVSAYASWGANRFVVAGSDGDSIDLAVTDGAAQGGTGAGGGGSAAKGMLVFSSYVDADALVVDLSMVAMVETDGSRQGAASVSIGTGSGSPIVVSLTEERRLSIDMQAYGDRALLRLTRMSDDGWDAFDLLRDEPMGSSIRLVPGDYQFEASLEASSDSALDLVMTFDEPMVGDLDGDGIVGAADLALLLGDWSESAGSRCGYASDLTDDCAVDDDDVLAIFQIWMTADDA
ncbi:MAG: hypothetical protein JNM94_01525 [Phycisphaerae bacterium]|nr:hypothetical protein [Phycisphaerae bacterium]